MPKMNTSIERLIIDPPPKPSYNNTKLTEMQQKFIDELLSGKHSSLKDCMLAAGYAEATAIAPSENVLDRYAVQEYLKRKLRETKGRARRISEKSLEHVEGALDANDISEINAFKVQTSLASLKIFEKIAPKIIDEDEKESDEIDPGQIRSLVIEYLATMTQDELDSLLNEVKTAKTDSNNPTISIDPTYVNQQNEAKSLKITDITKIE